MSITEVGRVDLDRQIVQFQVTVDGALVPCCISLMALADRQRGGRLYTVAAAQQAFDSHRSECERLALEKYKAGLTERDKSIFLASCDFVEYRGPLGKLLVLTAL